ncbi:TPA: inositol monophosphatase family protein [Streptococcus equi subsp. zooepidemicus]|uniref:inositol monophosphatase family protein n=1 Tax=Streptococcus equi TaxID=1336 RepID=UPI0005BB7A6A|nr:inositol monophosphatase family protein [Streptococcus equi]KIS13177.1 myo-inositol-1(or 4)-monophosphatase [Streptococcus equi subsp. zooepidemicus Sz105]KIS08143.1 myo-inositol-1(or 4)-monophosphatase [Streptococcus equi subsp. zooepidemicus Sz16]MCD3390938.1 inositol monophosphatase family protein [Streptococcus equi subsp. zooepidemicus]MCD3391039.1 inositol monophosphatase family protein [Streptococcus equi subsp. zooepidemicus]MCD3391042.1 inositol monophosphatase family protein [Stre
MEDKYAFAKTIIKEAGLLIKDRMKDSLAIEIKTQHDDLVTNVDQETQDFLIAKIKQAYPSDHMIAEEGDICHAITDGKVWVLDPIDGTVNFIVQKANFAIMMAYYENGIGKFGLIYDVMADQLFSGGGDFAVTLNDQALASYQDKPLDRSLIGCNAGMLSRNDYNLHQLIDQTLGVRVYGGAGICMTKVLRQQLMAYFSYIQPWDYAAAAIMGESLGYVLLTLEGKQPDFQSRQKVMFVPKSKLATIQSLLQINENNQ